MAKYLVSVGYSAAGAKGLIKDGGSKRERALTEAMKSAGITVESFYFALGEHDAFMIVDSPDHVAITAVALTINAVGAIHVSSTVLLTPAEVDAAVKKPVTYTPPGQ